MPYEVDSQRQRRRFTLAGLAGLLSVGALIPMLNSAPATVAQDITPVVPACRTILQGDQTSLYLYDLRQFVPVEGLAETSVAADTPAPAGTPVTAGALLATPVAEPTDEPDATPMAETTAEPVASAPASPMASPDASPIAEAVTVSDEDQLRSVVFGVLNCTNLRDFDTLADLATNTYLRNTFAGGADLPRTDLLALAEITVIPVMEMIAFDNVEVSDNSATAEVLLLSGNQLRHESWQFARSESTSTWKVVRVVSLDPITVEGSATVHVSIDDERLATDPRDVSGGNVVLIGDNTDSRDHEMLVLRLPAGATTEILLQTAGPGLPPGVDLIGQMTVPAGSSAVLPLMNLPVGNYVVVDMLLDDGGTPNFASGYRARLVIGD